MSKIIIKESMEDMEEKDFISAGATQEAFFLINGMNPPRGRFKSFKDNFGNNIWHYLSMSDNPCEMFELWKNKIKNEDVNMLNNKGLHFMHYLYATGKKESINEFNKKIPNLNYDISPVLFLSCCQNNEEFISELIKEKSGLINYQNEISDSPLKLITILHSPELLELILSEGADTGLVDQFGKTALHYAAEIGSIEKYNILENYYADDMAKSLLGKRPVDMIEKSSVRDDVEIERIIKKWENEAMKYSKLY